MKVLIITYYWPPAGGSGVQRWLKFVKYLGDFDIQPVVYTVKNANYPIEDVSLEKDIPKGVEVLRQPIWEPNSLFRKSSKKTSAGFLNPNPSFLGKTAQYIRANFFIPDARKFWVKPSVKYLSEYLKKNNIDVIITTGPPHSLHLIGLALKQQLGVKWIADFRDPWTEIDYFYQLPLTKGSLKNHHELEKQVVSSADSVLVVGKTMKANYLKFNSNIHVITNGFDTVLEEQAKLDADFSIVHIGMMNADRNPEILWKVISELVTENNQFTKDIKIKLIGKVANEVNKSVQKYGLNNIIEQIDYVSHSEVVKLQRKAQVLLLVVNNVPNAKGIVTGKIFEYLQAKRPILAITPTDGDLTDIINKTKAGIVIDFSDEALLKKNILELYTDFKNGTLNVSSQHIDQYHRRNLTKQLAEIISNLNE